MQLLITAKATVDQAANDGATPLLVASQEGHVEAMQALIIAKAAVDQASNDGATSLYAAYKKGMHPPSECSSRRAPVPVPRN